MKGFSEDLLLVDEPGIARMFMAVASWAGEKNKTKEN